MTLNNIVKQYYGIIKTFKIIITAEQKQFSRTTLHSQIAFSFDSLTFLNVKGDIPICSADLSSAKTSDYNKKNCIFHTYIYVPLQTQSQKLNDLLIGKY